MECLEKSKAKLDEDHPDTLSSINNLASVLDAQGLYASAEPLYVECLARRKAKLGEDHPDTLSTISNLAALYDTLHVCERRASVCRMSNEEQNQAGRLI